jgi:hypothetical protein
LQISLLDMAVECSSLIQMFGYTSLTNKEVSSFVFLKSFIYILMKPECMVHLLTTHTSAFHSLFNSRLVRFIKENIKDLNVLSLSTS